jgi:hypothetical protein
MIVKVGPIQKLGYKCWVCPETDLNDVCNASAAWELAFSLQQKGPSFRRSVTEESSLIPHFVEFPRNRVATFEAVF